MSLCQLLEERVKANPHGTYAILVPFGNIETGTARSVDWTQLKRAVTRAAHILSPLDEEGMPSKTGRVIAILAATDCLLYQALNLAIVQSGNIAMPISQRNSPNAVVNLLRKTDCHDVIVGGGSAVHTLFEETRSLIADEAPGHSLNTIPVPSATRLFPHLGTIADDVEVLKDYPLPADSDELEALRYYIHSSGTTSLPKPIPLTEKYVRYTTLVPFVKDHGSLLSAAMAIPPFHMMGIVVQVMAPLRTGAPIMLWDIVDDGEPAPMANPEITMQAMRRFGATSVLAVPAFLVAWSRNEPAIEYLRTMDRVITGGGPLPEEVGDHLVRRGVNVTLSYGGTEFTNGTQLKRIHRTPEEWIWLEFTEEYPARWEEQDSGLFELQLLESREFRPSIFNIETPDGPAYATNDLFMRHPTKPRMYKIVGRLDDQVTLATGEKVNPAPIELAMAESPLVAAAVLLGRAKNQVAILVQTTPGHEVDPSDSDQVAAFRNLLWPHVEKVNAKSAGFAKIFKETIILSTSTKPFAKTPKGTVQRKRTEELYATEIEEMYAAIDKARGAEDGELPEAWTSAALRPWVLQIVEELVQHSIDPSKDLFDQGADSLTATFLRLRCSSAMQRFPNPTVSSKARSLDANMVFAYPTIPALAQYLLSVVSPDDTNSTEVKQEHLMNMDSLLRKYVADLPKIPAVSTPESPDPTKPLREGYEVQKATERGASHWYTPQWSLVMRWVRQIWSTFTHRVATTPKESILITGTTGALGSALLQQAIESDRFGRVWAFNRPSSEHSGMERQQASFVDKGLDPSLLQHHKLQMIDTDTSADHLGLNLAEYEEISRSVTVIVHNAWRLDFNLSLQSFGPQIKSTRNLVDLALSSANASSLRFVFTSSVGVFPGWTDTSHPAPEEPIGDPSVSVGTGYGESKYVAEKILEYAREQTGLVTTSIRLGQLSGSMNGSWATSGWFPILLKSSLALGYLPDSPGSVSWISVDAAATSVLDAALTSTPERVLHIYHPKPTPWKMVLEAAADALPPSANGGAVPLLPFAEWLKKLEAIKPEDHDRIPGIKLLPFYRGLAAGDAMNRMLPADESHRKEAFGVVRISTEKMRSISPMLASLDPIPIEEVQGWVKHWQTTGFLPLV
ncbi:acetyl-CoA synthetase-like protein, partial [Clavulina sp. PMI_390]